MSQAFCVEYNGVLVTLISTRKFDITPLYTEKGKFWAYKHVIAVDGTVQWEKDGGALRDKLLVPRKPFSYRGKIAFDCPGPDVANGPNPLHVSVVPCGDLFKVSFEVELVVPVLEGNIAVLEGIVESSVKEMEGDTKMKEKVNDLKEKQERSFRVKPFTYHYWDGGEMVSKEATELCDLLRPHGLELCLEIKIAGSAYKDAAKFHDWVVAKVREVFQLRSLNEGGLSEAEVIKLLDHFLAAAAEAKE